MKVLLILSLHVDFARPHMYTEKLVFFLILQASIHTRKEHCILDELNAIFQLFIHHAHSLLPDLCCIEENRVNIWLVFFIFYFHFLYSDISRANVCDFRIQYSSKNMRSDFFLTYFVQLLFWRDFVNEAWCLFTAVKK